jgi:heptaprenyl diphosphate synthase
VPVASPSLLGLYSDDRPRIEAALVESVRSDDSFLTEVASHLLAGGKRTRPLFSVAAAGTAIPSAATDASIQGGIACELVHLGSLYHDDVMDEAVTRRGVDSVNARWGNLTAILAGDFLLARASGIAAALGTDAAALLSATIGRLCEGQLAELRQVFDPSRTVDAYYTAISGKTAALFRTACRVGALVSDQPPGRVEALSSFGLHYGLAFQVVDDLLDLVSTEEKMGKPVGHDLLEGVYTLPVLLTLHGPTGDQLKELLGSPLDPEQHARAISLVRDGDGIDYALDAARGHVAEAVEHLDGLAPTQAGQSLAFTAHSLVSGIEAAVEARRAG